MWKKIWKFLLTVAAIGASALAIFTWYKKKKGISEGEFSDIFEEDDFDLDESI